MLRSGIKDGKDIFGRDASFTLVKIDDSFPQYLREHTDEYEFLILREEAPLKKDFAMRQEQYAGDFSGQAIL